ncbi:MAG TPA: glycine/sarcosine/betaine reductase selenoprotein B family protein [Thermoanaerobaculia bacterium]|jgi:D-proline reductase (dithiol) PrdB|nr:glycine/sarcosine/betaine reductase selenoprotein B family protein [Thermoanaerobaculia bacterium]
MADLSDLPVSVRIFLKAYPWRRIDPIPWAPLRRPLGEAKIAIVSTAGLVPTDQEPFDNEVRGGDWSYREVPDSIDVATLVDAHRSWTYDHSGVRADPNLAFPIERLHELHGVVNHRHFSFMGSITAPGRLIKYSAPEVAEKLVADGVDAVLLVPI